MRLQGHDSACIFDRLISLPLEILAGRETFSQQRHLPIFCRIFCVLFYFADSIFYPFQRSFQVICKFLIFLGLLESAHQRRQLISIELFLNDLMFHMKGMYLQM